MDISEQRHLKTQLERDVEALADYMDTVDNSDGHFNMARLTYDENDRFPCGTPSCAKGHAYEFDRELWARLPVGGSDKFHELFGAHLLNTIHSPQQWSVHARAWLAARRQAAQL